MLTVGFPAVVFQRAVFSVACSDAALSLPHPYTYEGQLVGIVGRITKSTAQRFVVQSICSRAVSEGDLGAVVCSRAASEGDLGAVVCRVGVAFPACSGSAGWYQSKAVGWSRWRQALGLASWW